MPSGKRELDRGNIEPALGLERHAQQFEHSIRAGVGEELHEQQKTLRGNLRQSIREQGQTRLELKRPRL